MTGDQHRAQRGHEFNAVNLAEHPGRIGGDYFHGCPAELVVPGRDPDALRRFDASPDWPVERWARRD